MSEGQAGPMIQAVPMIQAGPMIIAIGSRDDFLHVYQDEQELLGDHAIGAGDGERSGPIEFFDSEGHRLIGEYDRQWRLLGLTRTTESPNPALVWQRVQNSLDRVRRYIENNSQQARVLGTTVAESLKRVQDLESANFETCLKELAHPDGDHQGTREINVLHRTRDPLHNWWHGAGWQL